MRELTKNNIIVHATNGAPDWVLDTSHVKHFLNAVHEYNNESQSDEYFHHIHLDIEPYKLSGWNRDRESKGSIIKSWDKIVDFYIAYTDIPVSATIPFWLYNEDVVLEQLYIFFSMVHEHLVVKTYADEYFGENSFESRMKPILQSLDEIELPKTIVGIINFNDKENKISLNHKLKTIEHELCDIKTFKGLLINDLKKFRTLILNGISF